MPESMKSKMSTPRPRRPPLQYPQDSRVHALGIGRWRARAAVGRADVIEHQTVLVPAVPVKIDDLGEFGGLFGTVPVVLQEDTGIVVPGDGPPPVRENRQAVARRRALEGHNLPPDLAEGWPHRALRRVPRGPEQVPVVPSEGQEGPPVLLEVVLRLVGILDPDENEVSGVLGQVPAEGQQD